MEWSVGKVFCVCGVSAALQRILLRAKRKPAPGIRRSMPGVSPALCVGGEDADAALGWRWECLQLSNGFPEATIQVWNFIGDGMAVKGIEGRDDRDAYCTERANWWWEVPSELSTKQKRLKSFDLSLRAEEGTWTLMILLSHGPEPCASANSATSASRQMTYLIDKTYYSIRRGICQEFFKYC